jgi:hypothetical protein
MFYNGQSQKEIARITGTQRWTIQRLCQKWKLKRENIQKPFTDKELIKHSHLTTCELSKKFKINQRSICYRLNKLGLSKTRFEATCIAADKIRKHNPDLTHFTSMDQIGCYYLGFIYADGHIRNRGNYPSVLGIRLAAKDRAWLEMFVNDLSLPTSIIKHYIDSRGFHYDAIQLSNIYLCDILAKYGLCPGEEYKKHIPKIKYHDHFVRGFLDGDGYITRNRKNNLIIGFAITYNSFGSELLSLIDNKINMRMNGPYPVGSITKITCSCRKALRLANWIWHDPIRCLDRKHQRYKEFTMAYNISC